MKSARSVRNRAMLELLYSSGLRLSECARLRVEDVGADTVTVRGGKGGRDRIVPLGAAAREWIDRYVRQARPRGALWVGRDGRPISAQAIQVSLRKLGVTAHTLRRTCATHLLSGGASVWAVRGILGHRDATSIGRYLAVTPSELKEAHEKTHPRA
jgi:integrase/recombinase XerD